MSEEHEEPTSGDAERYITIYGLGGVQTEIDLNTLGDSEVAEALPYLLADYAAECKDWTLLASEHWRKGRYPPAEEMLVKAIEYFHGAKGRPPDYLALVRLYAMYAHFHLARARAAPRASLSYAKYDQLESGLKPKEHHYTESAANLNKADQAHQTSGGSAEDEPITLALGKVILHLARGAPQLAHPLVERLAKRQPNNLVVLLAQARLLFAKRATEKALETYQKLLRMAPNMSPDPRIGLGLCLWVLGDKVRAKLAWEKANKRDPKSWVSLLLLGLASLNTARDPSVSSSDRLAAESLGIQYTQRAFKLNTFSPAAAIALSAASSQAGKLAQASKLAERAIQYSDNKRHTILANAERGRLGFVAGDVADAGPYIAAAKGEDKAGINIMAELTLGQIAIKNGNLREALNFIEQTAKRLNGTGPLEYTVLHACLLNYPHPGMSPDELARNRATARTMLTDLHAQVAGARTDEDWARLRGVGQDADIFLELAKMWQDESLDKAVAAYQTAVQISPSTSGDGDDAMNGESNGESKADLRVLKMGANLGALYQLQGSAEDAELRYQEALQRMGSQTGNQAEMMRTVLAFNLARAYEEQGEVVKAGQWYRDVLKQHPEHFDSKVRLAAIAASQGRNVDAHNLLKECLKSDESSLSLRSVYTHFLISINHFREALAFTTATLKYDRSDVYTFCALGWLHFALGREAKSGPELAERGKQYLRSAEAYERALTLDGKCTMAAQGLAIALVEDTLSIKGSGPPAGSAEELKYRMKLATQALGVLGRINDSWPDASTAVNMGHCFFIRGEEEKAVQMYEAAENHFQGKSVPNLLYLSRTWYAWANRDTNLSAMSRALAYAQKAMHILPTDRAILYNIAMIQQKSAEMVLSMDPSKRTLEELRAAVEQAQQAANTFRILADDPTAPLPYDKELADQRARYGDGLIRKAPEQIARQEAYEGEAALRVEEARKTRAEEAAKIAAAEAARRAELEARAAKMAEERREKMRALQTEWALEAERAQADAESKAIRMEKAAERKRRKEAGEDVDESLLEGEKKPRKKRDNNKAGGGGKKGRNVRSKSEISTESSVSGVGSTRSGTADLPGDGEGEGQVEEEEDLAEVRRRRLEQLKAGRKKKEKRKVEDPDDEPSSGRGRGGASNNAKFKSKAVIEDSDEELGNDDDNDNDAQSGGERSRSRSVSLAGTNTLAGDGGGAGTTSGQGGITTGETSRVASVSPARTPVPLSQPEVADGLGAGVTGDVDGRMDVEEDE